MLFSFTLSKCFEVTQLTLSSFTRHYARHSRCITDDVCCFRALSLDPKNHVLLSNRSAAFAGLEDYANALVDATSCIQNNPDFVKGHSRQAYAYLKLGKPGFAEKAYRQGLQLDPANPALKQGLASILKVTYCPCVSVCLSQCISTYWSIRLCRQPSSSTKLFS